MGCVVRGDITVNNLDAAIHMDDSAGLELLGKDRVVGNLVAVVELDAQAAEACLYGLDVPVAAHGLNDARDKVADNRPGGLFRLIRI